MTLEYSLIAWSIRLSMLLLVIVVACRIVGPKSLVENTVTKTVWTCAFALFVVHVLASFHFVHHWSHSAAYRATAKQTLELLGIEVGTGVYFNYLFLAVWAADVINAWTNFSVGRWMVQWLLRIGLMYMLFIAFNGVVVFESGWLRAGGISLTTMLVAASMFRFSRFWKNKDEPVVKLVNGDREEP